MQSLSNNSSFSEMDNAMDYDGEPVTRLSEDAGSNPSRRLVSISVIRSW